MERTDRFYTSQDKSLKVDLLSSLILLALSKEKLCNEKIQKCQRTHTRLVTPDHSYSRWQRVM